MDNDNHPEGSEQGRADDRPNEEKPTRRWEANPNASPAADPNAAGEGRGRRDPGADGRQDALLESGMMVGPADHRVRLLHDLSGHQRVWMALPVGSATQRGRGIANDFRAIKLFFAPGPEAVLREVGRDERSQRADLIGTRAYWVKLRARIEPVLKLDHPTIARAYGWHQGDGSAFVEMEYIDHQHSQSLTQLLGEQGKNGLPWDTVSKWLQPVGAALDHARTEHRLSHQHLDADKVFLTDQGAIKVVSFGLATELREPRSVLFEPVDPKHGATAEAAADLSNPDTAFRRDVFALALLVYQMLTGRSAYESKGDAAHVIPRPAGLADEAWRILRRGLAYPSELCPVEAGKFIGALDEAQRPAEQAGQRRQSARLNWAAAAGLFLLLGLGLYRFFGSEEGAVDPERPPRAAAPTPAPPPEAVQDAGLNALLQEAEREADLRAFESAKRVDTVVAYQLYLQRCPRCGYRQEARNAVQNLETEQKIEQLKTDFEKLARALERENREDRGDEALERLNALAALAPGDPLIAAGRRRIALNWVSRAQASARKNDLAGARQAFKKASAIQPDLTELEALTATLQQVETTEQVNQSDSEAFAAARRANTRKAYWNYLEKCGTACNHRPEAEAALSRLSPSNALMRDRLSDGSQGPELVVIPAGGFEMGSPSGEKGRYSDEQQQAVRLAKPFAIGKYELMFFEYERFASATGRPVPDDHGWGRGRRPVINVSWRDAKDYTDWLSQQTGRRYRLPTEAEWEYAARAGTATSRYWGDDPNQGCADANAGDLDGKKVFVGWTVMQCRDGYIYTAPAGSYRNNDYGLHDMMGNVLEWTCSLYGRDYGAPGQSCQEPEGERQFVVRGGSWNDEPRNVRSADRHRNAPEFRDYYLGFRVVRELP
ncbi:MAG: SUMF1/EgtB/PvdO family nonheme iron enzyme [Candidatus Competibacteraceae bacterium]|nr:SUMF1/EgtB/PvdO family nonheme iron enzyme [Candidatus Competibacteraceae bacterium]